MISQCSLFCQQYPFPVVMAHLTFLRLLWYHSRCSGRSAVAWPKGASRVRDSLQAPPGFCFIETSYAFDRRNEKM